MFTIFDKVPKFNKQLFEAKVEGITPTQNQVLFIIDRSGSMSCAWEDVIRFSNGVISKNPTYKDIPVIYYNDEISLGSLKDIKNSIYKPQSTTDFKKALYAAKNYVCLVNKKKEIDIIFMTDGQDNCNNGCFATNINSILDELKIIFKTISFDTTFHVLTFTNNVNYNIIKKISELGTNNGLIKHIDNQQDLEDGFNDMLDMVLHSQHIEIKFTGITNQAKVRIQIVDNIGYCLLNDDLKYKTLEYNNHIYQISSKKLTEKETFRFYQMIEPTCLEEVENIIENLQYMTFNLEIMTRIELIKDKFLNKISEDDLLKLESLTHDHVFRDVKRKIKMDERIMKNKIAFKEIQKELFLSFKKLKDDDGIVCSLTGSSLSELKYSDVIGIGIQAIITDNILSPTSAIKFIDFVTWNYISFIGFIDIQNQAIKSKGTDAHGRFSLDKNKFTYISGNSKVNAFLPLYINNEHYERVKLLEPRWLGLLFTQNSFGFDEVQYYGFCVIVFMFYQKYGKMIGKYQEILENLIKVARGMVEKPRLKNKLQEFIETGQGFPHIITPIAIYFILEKKPIPYAEFNRLIFWYHNQRIGSSMNNLSNFIGCKEEGPFAYIDYTYDPNNSDDVLRYNELLQVTTTTTTQQSSASRSKDNPISKIFKICLQDPHNAEIMFDKTAMSLKTKKKLAKRLEKLPNYKDDPFYVKVTSHI